MRRFIGAILLGGALMAAFVAGVPFKVQSLLSVFPHARIAVQAAFGADLTAAAATWTWTDITKDVRKNDGNLVSITPIGRSDESPTAQPATCSFVLDNRSGDYSAYHGASVYYPNVRQNTPIRVLINLTGDDANTSTRFFGYANGWPMSWQDDGTARIPIVTVTASGVTRQRKQGKTQNKAPITSALRYYMTSSSGVLEYWPLETDTHLANVINPTNIAVVTSSEPEWDKLDGPPGGGRSAGFFVNDDRPPTTQVRFPVTSINTNEWTASVWIRAFPGSGTSAFFSVPVVDFIEMGVTGGSSGIGSWSIECLSNPPADQYEVTAVSLAPDRTLGTPLIIPQVTGINVHDGNWHLIALTVAQSGANISATLTVDDPLAATGGSDTQSSAGTNGILNAVYLPKQVDAANIQDLSLSNLAVYDSSINIFSEMPAQYEAGYGYIGELATDRLARVAEQVGIPISLTGTSETTMGSQSADTLMNTLRECETADGGLLLDGFGQGFLYITRDARYNQTADLTVSAVGAQLGIPFGPVDNDQRIVNRFTATRKNGSSFTYEDTDGTLGTGAIGIFDSSGTYNLDSDTNIADYASWGVHLGTVEGFRYPTLTLDFTAQQVATLADDWLTLAPLDLITVTAPENVFSKHPPGDINLIVEGWSEQISEHIWRVTVNCSPGAPWAVGTIEGDERLDCGASTLNGSHNSTTTSLSVTVGDSCFWAHDDGDYPILVGGEVMTVTAVGAASSPQTLTVTRSVNGIVKSHSSGEEVHVLHPIILAL